MFSQNNNSALLVRLECFYKPWLRSFSCAVVCVLCIYPLLGGLVAEMQGSGVPVHSDISISYRGPVLRALYCATPAEP